MDSIEYQKLKIHLIYLVSFLSFMLILTACSIWTPREDFTAVLSNSATATSLVLGVVAIIYSFISNSDLSKGLGNITLASSEIGKTKDQISAFLGQVQNMNQIGLNNSDQLGKVSSHITSTVEALNNTLEAISAKTNELQSSVNALPKRIDDLEIKFIEENNKRNANEQAGSSIVWSVSEIERFLARTSLTTNLLTYACSLAYEKRSEICTDTISDLIEVKVANYFNGFLSAMHGAEMVTRKHVPDKTRTFVINKIAPLLTSDLVKKYFVEYVKVDSGFDESDIQYWLNKLEVIEKHYS